MRVQRLVSAENDFWYVHTKTVIDRLIIAVNASSSNTVEKSALGVLSRCRITLVRSKNVKHSAELKRVFARQTEMCNKKYISQNSFYVMMNPVRTLSMYPSCLNEPKKKKRRCGRRCYAA